MEKYFLYILFFASLVLPASPAIANILLLIFGGGVVVQAFAQKRFPGKKDWFFLLILPSFFFLFALTGAVSQVFFGSYGYESLRIAEKYIPFFVLSLAYIVSSPSLKEKAFRFVSAGLTAGVVASTLYLLIVLGIHFFRADEESVFSILSHRFTYYNFTNPLKTHPTYFSIWILAANYFIFKSRLSLVLKSFLLGILFLGMTFTMSRAGVLLYGFQILAFFFLLSRKWKLVFLAGVTVFLLFGIYLYKFQSHNFYLFQRFSIELTWDTNIETGTEINNRVADDSRNARWTAIWETIMKKPVFGYGAGSETAVLKNTYAENDLWISLERNYNTHNQYLYYLLEYGFLGLIVFLAFFSVNIIKAIKLKDMFVVSFITAILIVFFFENYMYRSMGNLTMALFLTFLRKYKK